jgi:glucuronosyltransferase
MEITSKFFLLFGIIFALQYQEIIGARILSISIMSSKSHKNVYEPLLKELANRGHQVTIVTPVKASKPYPNITEIIGIPYHTMMNGSDFDVFRMKLNKETMNPFTQTIPMFEKFGPEFFTLPQVQDVLKQDFDLVLMSAFMNECIFGVIPHFKAPFIFISPIAAPAPTVASVGNPMPMSFSPLIFFI